MPKTNLPSLTQTKLDNDSVTDAKISVGRTVTYIFDIVSAKNLSIPYAVSVGGSVQSEFKSKPKRVSGEHGKIIVRNVEPGTKVSLYLNSDAHPNYRKNPVYAVTPVDRNVIVKVREKEGRCSETDAPVRESGEKMNEEDVYSSVLNGDIWMKISHKYCASEVDSLLPSDDDVVKVAVKKIYEGLRQTTLEIEIPEVQGRSRRNIVINFEDSKNPRENIRNGYDFLKEGLTRVHPAGYAAVISAAIEAGIDKIVMTSAWRPMLGSIAHRAGLGLDISYVGVSIMNREELRKKRAIDTPNVSEIEKKLFLEFESSEIQEEKAKRAIETVNAEIKNAKDEPGKLVVAKKNLKEAKEAFQAAEKNRRDAEMAWNDERNKNEPKEVRDFRNALMKCKSVVQIFDPWFMDANSRDDIPPTPNMQISGNEKLHSHHLHITIHEPKIL